MSTDGDTEREKKLVAEIQKELLIFLFGLLSANKIEIQSKDFDLNFFIVGLLASFQFIVLSKLGENQGLSGLLKSLQNTHSTKMSEKGANGALGLIANVITNTFEIFIMNTLKIADINDLMPAINGIIGEIKGILNKKHETIKH